MSYASATLYSMLNSTASLCPSLAHALPALMQKSVHAHVCVMCVHMHRSILARRPWSDGQLVPMPDPWATGIRWKHCPRYKCASYATKVGLAGPHRGRNPPLSLAPIRAMCGRGAAGGHQIQRKRGHELTLACFEPGDEQHDDTLPRTSLRCACPSSRSPAGSRPCAIACRLPS